MYSFPFPLEDIDTFSSVKTINIWEIQKEKEKSQPQVILGKNHYQYLKKYFEKFYLEKKREQTYMEKIIFQIISMLRDENLKLSFQTQNYEIDYVDHPICLRFMWLHTIYYENKPISTILKVQNVFSKQQVYLLDSQEYNKYSYQFEKAMDNENKCYKNYIILYAKKQDSMQVVIPSFHPQIPSRDKLLTFNKHQIKTETFYIQVFDKDVYKSYDLQKKLSFNLQLGALDDAKKMEFGTLRDNQLKFYFLTKRIMPQKLRRYKRSITVVINDMLKFVGFNEIILFQANYQTNQVELVIRNSKIASFCDLKTSQIPSLPAYDTDQAKRYMYTTQLRQKNMLVFLNYCEQQKIVVVHNCDFSLSKKNNEAARHLLLSTVDISTHKSVEKSKVNLMDMELSRFNDCILYQQRKKEDKTQYPYKVETVKIKDFIKRYNQKKQNQQNMIKDYRNYTFWQPPYQERSTYIEQNQWAIKEKTFTTNLRQLLVIDAMIRQEESKIKSLTKNQININKYDNRQKEKNGYF